MPKIKICGIKSTNTTKCINECMPDFVGFVFAKSKREISIQEALNLRKSLNDKIRCVGVFDTLDIDKMIKCVESKAIDLIQIHTAYNRDFLKEVSKLKVEIIQSVIVKSQNDIYKAREIQADYLLFDSGSGSGESMELQALDFSHIDKKYFIAGGLNVENIQNVISLTKPFGVDVSSGVESEIDGKSAKDDRKIRDFISKVQESK